MGDARLLVLGNMRTFIETIGDMTEKERSKQPSGTYGKNFNTCLREAKRLTDGITEELWPEPLEVSQGSLGTFTNSTYREMETYARQIVKLIESTIPDMRGAVRPNQGSISR